MFKLASLLLYIVLQVFYFTFIFVTLSFDSDYSNILKLTSYGLLLAKSSAGIINLNFALLFLLINKKITYAISIHLPTYIVHIIIVSTILLATILHVASHIYNFIILEKVPFPFMNQSSIPSWLSVTSITGIVLSILFSIIYSISFIRKLKKCNFNVFYYIHLLWIPIVILTLLHGSFCFIKTNEETCYGSNFWKFIIGPIILFFGEKIICTYYSYKKCTFVNIKQHSNSINEIELYKDKFEFKPGQWILVNCPSISKLEWHPFSITSDPTNYGTVKIYIKNIGDWTTKFVNNADIKIRISYPYGVNILDLCKSYSIIVLIANGIGITGFMSLIKSITIKQKQRSVHLHWVCRNSQDFNCFISELHHKVIELNNSLVEFKIYFYITGHDRKKYPPFEFIYSRPNFTEIFTNLQTQNPSYKIRVLFCGTDSLNNDLIKICKEFKRIEYQQGEIFN